MADVITRFKLETTQFDSKLRDTAKELQTIARTAEKGGKDFNSFSQKSIEAARALGTVKSGATNAKDKLRDLVGSFNDAAKAYNSLSDAAKKGDFGRALSASLQKLQQDIRKTKQEIDGKGGGGLLGGLFSGDKMSGMLQVFGGNMMSKAAGMVANFASEIGDAVKQGIELAKQGEGIRQAFQRLGRGDLLDGLREATHNTVNDIELMKAAVRFADFNLPLEELGTMLAFAQQKAKDTGQSLDYMVESIVLGLGRQSKPIMDNLGISATQLNAEMKKTGDFTKAAANIIRDQMAKAGDYVETAADRAAQASTAMQNKMEELGRQLVPLEGAFNDFWTEMKIAILDIVGGPLTRLLNGLSEAGRLRNALADINERTGDDRTLSQKRLDVLRAYSGSQKGLTKQGVYDRMMARFAREENQENREAQKYRNLRIQAQKKLKNIDPKTDEKGVQASLLQQQIASYREKELLHTRRSQAYQLQAAEFEKGAQEILHPTKPSTISGGGSDSDGNDKNKNKEHEKSISQQISELTEKAMRTEGEELEIIKAKIRALMEEEQKRKDLKESIQSSIKLDIDFDKQLEMPIKPVLDETGMNDILANAEKRIKEMNIPEQGKKVKESWKDAAAAVSSVGDAMQNIDDPSVKIVGLIGEAIANIALGFGKATAKDTNLGVFGWIAAIAGGLGTMISTISAIHSATGYAEGGIIKGNSYSGDNLMGIAGGQLVGLNAQEVVLNAAQSGNLASALTGVGTQNMRLTATVTGEQLRLVLNNNARRTGRGETLMFK